jgi:hypothetical protein
VPFLIQMPWYCAIFYSNALVLFHFLFSCPGTVPFFIQMPWYYDSLIGMSLCCDSLNDVTCCCAILIEIPWHCECLNEIQGHCDSLTVTFSYVSCVAQYILIFTFLYGTGENKIFTSKFPSFPE